MKRILVAALALVMVGTGLLALTAFRGHPDPARMQRFVTNRVDDMLDAVHATDAQRQQVHAITDKLLADGSALRSGGADVRQQLLAAWQSDQPDAARVHALVDGRADAMRKFADEVTDAVLQVHTILTPDQRAIVTKHLQRHLSE